MITLGFNIDVNYCIYFITFYIGNVYKRKLINEAIRLSIFDLLEAGLKD